MRPATVSRALHISATCVGLTSNFMSKDFPCFIIEAPSLPPSFKSEKYFQPYQKLLWASKILFEKRKEIKC